MNEIWVESRSIAKRFNLHHMGEKGKWTEASVRSGRDLSKLVEAQKAGATRAFISCSDWSLLPQKEISQISKKLKLIAKVNGAEQAKEAKTITDLEKIIKRLMDEGGDTAKHGFVVFSWGGKEHIYVSMSDKTREAMKRIVRASRDKKVDVNEIIEEAIVDAARGLNN